MDSAFKCKYISDMWLLNKRQRFASVNHIYVCVMATSCNVLIFVQHYTDL